MSQDIWIKNGVICDPANGRNAPGELFISEGKIVAGLSDSAKAHAIVIDAGGHVVAPGFVDIHVHFREPGQTHKESIATGTYAAAAGGFTTVVCMPNTTPPADSTGTIRLIQDSIAKHAVIDVFPTGCLTKGMAGSELAPMGSLKNAGVVAVTDDGHCVQSNEIMRRAVEYAHMFDLVVMDHCQDYAMTKDAVMNEGEWSLRLGLRGWPCAAEDIIVARNIILSAHTGAHIHLQHISSAYAVDTIRRAKDRRIRITAEAMPHHMALTDACLHDYNPNFKMNPPLRTEADRKALIDGLLDGTIDIIATDHAPHTYHEKDVEFDRAPFGITGLETALPVCLDILTRERDASVMELVNWLTHKPATLMGFAKGTLSVGADADVTIFDPGARWTCSRETCYSKSMNSPWLGTELTGRVLKTISHGRVVFDGTHVFKKGTGEAVPAGQPM